MKIKSFKTSFGIMASICLITIIAIGVIYINYLISNEKTTLSNFMFEITEKNNLILEAKIMDYVHTLNGMSAMLGVNEYEPLEYIDAFKSELRRDVFMRLGYIDMHGNFIGWDRESGFLEISGYSDKDLFLLPVTGGYYISEPMDDVVLNEPIILISVPIYDKNLNVSGVLCGFQTAEFFGGALEKPVLSGKGISFVINSDAKIMFSSNPDAAEILVFENAQRDKKIDQIKKDLKLRLSGSSDFTFYNDNLTYLIYSPTTINDWYIGTLLPTDVLNSISSNIVLYSTGFTALVIIVIFILVILSIKMYVDKYNTTLTSKAKTMFLSNMSHEIRTPINAIMGMSMMAKKVEHLPKKAHDYLSKIDTSANHLLSILNDILDMSRIESGKVDLDENRFDVNDILANVKDIISLQAEKKNIDFFIQSSLSISSVIGDDLKLSQVLVNLCANAVKFTPEGGKITVVANEVSSDSLLETTTIKFIVKDTGIGIPKNKLDKVFKAFEQAETDTTRKFGGTGLGLTISSSYVSLMGGTLEVDSEEEQGSQFFFELTFKTFKEKVVEIQKAKKAEAVSYKDINVLLVEDNELNMEISKAILEEKGFIVDIAWNGKEALGKFESSPSGFYSLIFMDVIMPEMDGLSATREIRRLKRDDSALVPIIAMSANAYDEDVKASLGAGMSAHLIKPIDLAKLDETIISILS